MNKVQGVELNDYKSRTARPDFYNNHLLSTESADMTTKQGHILLQKNLQLKFLGSENEQLREKVENLQKMVKVNKEIMQSLLQQECQNSMSQSTSADTLATQKLKNNIDILSDRNA
jgi:uncharacterized protein YigA (DUF484 family)